MHNVIKIMASSGCIRVVFLVFNVLFWLIGLGSVGYGMWILVTNDISLFLSGSIFATGQDFSRKLLSLYANIQQAGAIFAGGRTVTKAMGPKENGNYLSNIFTYAILSAGAFITILGLLGCIGGCAESTCCLKVYVGLMVTLLFVDIGVIIAGCLQKEMSFYVMDELWHDLNLDMKEHIQKQLGCCGYSNNTEYGSSIPGSCYQEGILTNTTCEDAMRAWVEGNIPVWASFLGGIGLIQIVSFILSCCVLKRLECLMKVRDSGFLR